MILPLKPVFSHAYQWLAQNDKLILGESYFFTKISQAWPMVTHAYWPFNGIMCGLISTHVSSFIKIGRKMTKLVSEKLFFRLKSVRRDPWSSNHIGLLMDSSLGWHLPTLGCPKIKKVVHIPDFVSITWSFGHKNTTRKSFAESVDV